ncbi:MAG: signal peptidase I [Actinomycetota bacterium]|nr:signal peptidase I [Actinomycetota bacterium]
MAIKPPGPVETDEDAAPAPEKEPGNNGILGFLKELPVLVVLAFVLALLIKTFLIQAFYIPSQSMEPTLLPGDRVLVNKIGTHFGTPQRGDIIVFENPHPTEQPHRNAVSAFFHWVGEGLGLATPPNEDFIKRVIGLPGDTVEVKQGVTYVNGKALVEPYIHLSAEQKKHMQPYGPYKVPPNDLFVLGDNRLNSNDSRFELGPVPMDKVIGKAFVTIWPPSRLGWLH